MHLFGHFARVCPLLLAGALAGAAEPAENSLGRAIGGFTLRDVYGAEHSLAQLAERPLVAVVFVGVECPLARLYAPRLEALAQEFSDRGVAVLAIDSNRQDALSELKQFALANKLSFPVLKDPGNVVADQFGATRTPEVFLLDAARVVRYQGRIDDQYGVGFRRRKPRCRDLALAIEALLAERPIEQPYTEPPGCLIGRVREASSSSSAVTWHGQIARVFQQHCQRCHRPGQIGPFPLLDYDEVVGWADMIGEVVRERRMPPWHASGEFGHFANDVSLPDAERDLILEWVAQGAPAGNPAEGPPPAKFAEGWQIPEPDRVLYMSDEPYRVRAEGTIDYQYFTVDPHFEEEQWLQAVECQAGSPAVVHHMAVWVWMPGEPWIGAFRHFLAGSAAGWGHMIFPEGTVRSLPAGAKLVFVQHYSPVGTPQEDRSRIGLVFADRRLPARECTTVVAENVAFEIPPHASDQRVTASYTFDRDALLIGLFPHMHLRGRTFRYVAHLPGGAEEVLLDVPRYDFEWQENYVLAEPKRMPRGTRVEAIAQYDNSADNPVNPDPNQTVRWGHQSWDEMMDGFLQVSSIEPRSWNGGAVAERPWLRGRPWLAGILLAVPVAIALQLVARRVKTQQAAAALPTIAALLVLAAPAAWLWWSTARAERLGWVADSPTMARAAVSAVQIYLVLLATLALTPAFRAILARRWRQLLLAVAATVLAVFVGEGIVRLAGLWQPYRLRPSHSHYAFAPLATDYFGAPGPCHATYNAQGVRGAELPATRSGSRVLCLGGGTTENTYLDDGKTWPAILRRQLATKEQPVWVGNAGIEDATLAEHVALVRDWPAAGEMDWLVAMPGANDLLRLLLYNDAGDGLAPAWYESATCRMAREAWNVRLGHGVRLEPTGQAIAERRRLLPILAPSVPLKTEAALENYTARLRELAQAARQRRLRLALVTQPVLWSLDLSWEAKQRLRLARVVPAGREWNLLTSERLRPLVERFNEATRRVAGEAGLPVVDLAASLTGREELFYDDFHFNEAGSLAAAEQIARELGPLVADQQATAPRQRR